MMPEYGKYPIILIEGGDASGKSTLAQQIMAKYPNHVYMHNAVNNDILKLHQNTIDAALIASHEHVVIIDRLHISEKVYGEIFRDGASYNVEHFDEQLNSIPNLFKILCHVDKETACKIHDSRKEIEMFSDNSKVWDKYEEISKILGPRWIKYNWKTDVLDLDKFEVTRQSNNDAG